MNLVLMLPASLWLFMFIIIKFKKKKKKGLCGQKKLHSSSLGGLKMPSNHHDDSLLPHWIYVKFKKKNIYFSLFELEFVK